MKTGTQSLIDDFNDNSFNTSIWSSGDPAVTETGGKLSIHAVSNFPSVRSGPSTVRYDISTRIMALKLSSSGSADSNTLFYFGIEDDNFESILVEGSPINNSWSFLSFSANTVLSNTVGEGSGFGTDLTPGNWVGLGNLGNDNIIHLYKSSDGSTWFEIGRCAVSGSFDKTSISFYLMAGASTTVTWTAIVDDASVFLVVPDWSGGFFDGI